jgi:hypothetical protein
MTGVVRIAILAGALLLLYAVGQYAMNHWTCWAPETKASVWVAVGTLLLAVATAWSVWETRLVIRGEDRRHQQSFAPFLVVGDHFNNGEDYHEGYTLHNYGSGVALDISFTVRGKATLQKFTAALGYMSEADHEKWVAEHTQFESRDLDDTYSCSAMWEGGTQTFTQAAMTVASGVLTDVTYSFCAVQYSDTFGNRYETRYTDSRLDKFKWIQPDSLRIPGSGSPNAEPTA